MKRAEFQALRAVEDRHAWFVGRRRAVRPLLERAHEGAPPGYALDLGAGTGGNGHLLETTLTGRPIVALDASPWAGGPAPWLRARAEELPLRAATLSVATAFDCLEHCQDDARVLSQLARGLRPGGQLVLTVPAHASLYSDHDRALGHARRYDRRELQAALGAAGFEVIELRGFNRIAAPAVALARKLRGARTQPRSDVRPLPHLANALLDGVLRAEERLPRSLRELPGLSWFARARRT